MNNLFTRRQIIEQWESSPNYLDKLCCPDCRGILENVQDSNYYFCSNKMCRNTYIYNSEGRILGGKWNISHGKE